MKAYRHGEIALVEIDALPEGIKASKEKTFMVGSHGHNHSIDNGTLFFQDGEGFVFGYLEAKKTTLFHPEHGENGKAKIKDGFYKLVKQQEYTPEGLVPIID